MISRRSSEQSVSLTLWPQQRQETYAGEMPRPVLAILTQGTGTCYVIYTGKKSKLRRPGSEPSAEMLEDAFWQVQLLSARRDDCFQVGKDRMPRHVA